MPYPKPLPKTFEIWSTLPKSSFPLVSRALAIAARYVGGYVPEAQRDGLKSFLSIALVASGKARSIISSYGMAVHNGGEVLSTHLRAWCSSVE